MSLKNAFMIILSIYVKLSMVKHDDASQGRKQTWRCSRTEYRLACVVYLAFASDTPVLKCAA